MNRVYYLCFIGMGSHLTVMRLLFCLIHPLLRDSGKDKTMKRIPRTPIEFDYDLWTTEDGKCMVRIKLTGEITEVDREVMKALRAEEKKLRRSMTGVPVPSAEDGEATTILSLDYVSYEDGEEMSPAWLADPQDLTSEVVTEMMEADFIRSLTSREKEVYTFCIRNGGEQQEYAAMSGLSISRVSKIIAAIRKKAKIFF